MGTSDDKVVDEDCGHGVNIITDFAMRFARDYWGENLTAQKEKTLSGFSFMRKR